MWFRAVSVIILFGLIRCNPVGNTIDEDGQGSINTDDGLTNLTGRTECATKDGRPGKCYFAYCRNLSDGDGPPSNCPGSSFYKCCPDSSSKVVTAPPRVENCGIRPLKTSNLIVGGDEAQPNSWPWAVALYRQRNGARYFQCGGSLISNRFILTAAHCVVRGSTTGSPKEFIIKVGAHDITKSGEFVEVEKVISHESYSSRYHNDDIALLKLKKPLNFTSDDKIAAVCLPQVGSEVGRNDGEISTVVGWGVHKPSSYTPSTTLYEVQIPISNLTKCQNAYESLMGSNKKFDWNNVVCASIEEGGKDSCQGDSGGPLTMPAGKTFQQVGIVSFGYSCASPGYPGVYTFVPHYLAWIGSHMK